VDVSVHQGRVTLSGSFATHQVEKFLSAVTSIADITAVDNRLKGDHAIASAGGVRDNHIMHQRDS
jgi:osmotically-inducible protein OsmY